jgi:hypothetical protein
MEQTTEQLRADVIDAYTKAEDAAARLFSSLAEACANDALPEHVADTYKAWKVARAEKRIAQEKLQNRINKP